MVTQSQYSSAAVFCAVYFTIFVSTDVFNLLCNRAFTFESLCVSEFVHMSVFKGVCVYMLTAHYFQQFVKQKR